MYSGKIQAGKTILDVLFGAAAASFTLIGLQLHREQNGSVSTTSITSDKPQQ